MKVVILAGGLGTRLSEETTVKPKPMIEIGGKPIIWHIMKIYASYGFTEFIVCLGYKGYIIKEFFANYFLHCTDVTIDLKNNQIKTHESQAEHWTITLIDTGNETMTGGRIKRIQSYTENAPFLLTYGDGLSNVNIKELVSFHQQHGKYCTVTAIQPIGRFGALDIQDGAVKSFIEKPRGDGAWVSGGFFVCQPEIFSYIDGDQCVWERNPMEQLASEGQMSAYKHQDFWMPMDTLRDKNELDVLWSNGKAPWKIW